MTSSLRRRGAPLIALATVSALALVACGGNGDSEGLSGTVAADGSSTVGPLTSVAAELYAEEEPDVKVSVGTHGTGGGFEKFCAGEIDIADASRSIKDSEIAACQQKGVQYAQLIVANDAITVVVNKDNDFATCLTTAQLRAIWDSGSTVDTWSELDPSFPGTSMPLYGPGTDSGTFDFFTKAINGEEGRSRTDYTPSEDDNLLVRGVADVKGALGYFGYTYYEENTDKLNALEVDGGGGCVAPSRESVQDASYTPPSRPLYIYVSDSALQRDEVVDFLEYYIDHIDEIVDEAHFIPLTETQKQTLADEYAALKAQATKLRDPLVSAGVGGDPGDRHGCDPRRLARDGRGGAPASPGRSDSRALQPECARQRVYDPADSDLRHDQVAFRRVPFVERCPSSSWPAWMSTTASITRCVMSR